VVSRFDRAAEILFTAIVLAQLALGTWRARLLESSVYPAIALAGVLSTVGAFWYARRHEKKGSGLAKPMALLSATIGVLSGGGGYGNR